MSGNWTGYRLPESPATYDDLRDNFEWQVPDNYNVAAVALDGDSDAVALHHVPESGCAAALDGEMRTVTYGALADASAAVALHLAAKGVTPGDRVAVCLPQCPEQVVVHLAVYRLGGVVVPVSMLLGDAAMAHVLTHSDADALFVDEQRWSRIATGSLPDIHLTVIVSVDAKQSALGGLAEFAGDVRTAVTPPFASTTPSDPAIVLYTSGTTSNPKGVVQTHQYLLGSLPGYHCWFDLFDPVAAREARVWTPSEWAWAGALFNVVLPTLAVGGTVVSSVRRSGFDPERAVELVRTESVTHAFFPPTALRKLRQSNVRVETPSLTVIMSGGEALPKTVSEWAERAFGATVNESYGETEANALAGESKDRFGAAAAETLGRPYPGHQLAVIDADGKERPHGELGEIAVGRPDPVVMQGYLDDPDTTQGVLGNRWLRTGDLGRFTVDGELEHLGRRDELIISSGYRISPLEVESVLSDHPDVAAALVRGEPNKQRGQDIVAMVLPTNRTIDGSVLTVVLRTHVADVLGPFKRPHRFDFVSELPTTRTGKIDRSWTRSGSDGS